MLSSKSQFNKVVKDLQGDNKKTELLFTFNIGSPLTGDMFTVRAHRLKDALRFVADEIPDRPFTEEMHGMFFARQKITGKVELFKSKTYLQETDS